MSPWDFSESLFGRSNKSANQEKLRKEAVESSGGDAVESSGDDAALRVFQYGTLFENVGKVLQYLNAVAAGFLGLFILFIDLTLLNTLLGLILLALFWAFTFLLTSLVRGLASYFQMKSSAYLQKYSPRNKKSDIA